MKVAPPVVLIDAREKRPLALPNARQVFLTVGDYSLEGMTDLVAVERKSLADLYFCVGHDRARFRKQMERLAQVRYPALVIEGSLDDILAGLQFSDTHPHSVIGTVISWCTRYRIPCWPCSSRRQAAATTLKILLKGAKYGNYTR